MTDRSASKLLPILDRIQLGDLSLTHHYAICFTFSFILGCIFTYITFFLLNVQSYLATIMSVYIFASYTGYLYHWLLHQRNLTGIFSDSHFAWHHRPLWLMSKSAPIPELYTTFCNISSPPKA
eukprot:TRINITY_DN8666_c0_g1_i1.p1 TRINITY_DN8666_c0_g1~~TRINITY_DN8666_c0_g1_i1.p1  ORF type:complete len:123 (+),score=13.17 TRINITY_DN8666_c0_g1_i1:3-371(+)